LAIELLRLHGRTMARARPRPPGEIQEGPRADAITLVEGGKKKTIRAPEKPPPNAIAPVK